MGRPVISSFALSLDFYFVNCPCTKQTLNRWPQELMSWAFVCPQSWDGVRAILFILSLQSLGNQGPERGEDCPGSHDS